MSSILKALKKVEVETEDKNSLLAWPEGLDTRAAIRRRVRVRRFSHYSLRLAITAACVLGVGAGWYFLSGREGETQSQADVGPASAPPGRAHQVAGRPATDRTQGRMPAKALTRRTASREKPTGTPMVAGSPAAAKPVRPAAARRPAVKPRSANAAAGPQTADTPPLLAPDQGQLKLQAISWTQNPEGRIAVVNGQIVKEGAAVEGYTIRHIRQDDVIVRSGANDWRLVFNHNPP